MSQFQKEVSVTGGRPLGRLARWAQRLVTLAGLVSFLGMGVAAAAAVASRDVSAPVNVQDYPAGWLLVAHVVVAGVSVATLCITGVVFLMWLWRADAHATAVSSRPRRCRRGWLIGGWFVPIANCVIPKQLMDDLWRRARSADSSATGEAPVPRWLHWWWATYLAGWLIGHLATTGDPELPTGLALLSISHAFDTAAAVLAVLVVRSVTTALTRTGASGHRLPVC